MSNQVWRSLVTLGFSLNLVVGCGSSEDDGRTTTGGAGQAAGGAAGASGSSQQGGGGAASGGKPASGGAGSSPGGSGSGGTSAAGNSSGGSGGDFVAAQCRPSPMAPQLSTDCTNYQFEGSGVPEDGSARVESSPLRQTLVAGTKTAFSITHLGDPATIEIWGTTSSCGPGVQKLLSGDVTEGPYCFEFTPKEAFSEILYVARGSAPNRSTGYFNPQFCTAGTCP